MQKICKLAFVLFTVLLFAACAEEQNKPSNIELNDLPGFIRPIAVRNYANELIGTANSVIIDKQKGILVTNAHVVKDAKSADVRLESGWFRAGIDKLWINWEADIALVRLKDWVGKAKLEEASLTDEIPPTGSILELKGYLHREEASPKAHLFYQHWRRPTLKRQQTTYCVTIGSCGHLLKLLEIELELGSLPKEMLSYFYTEFIHFENANASKTLSRKGLSGSPFLDEKGRVVGILSDGNNHHALAIPAKEIKKLLKKVKAG